MFPMLVAALLAASTLLAAPARAGQSYDKLHRLTVYGATTGIANCHDAGGNVVL